MRFRPCIDIHNGKVKQIVGGSLTDRGDRASTNFVADKPADWFAGTYQEDGLYGGHVILLNPASSPYFEETKKQAPHPLVKCLPVMFLFTGRSGPAAQSGGPRCSLSTPG